METLGGNARVASRPDRLQARSFPLGMSLHKEPAEYLVSIFETTVLTKSNGIRCDDGFGSLPYMAIDRIWVFYRTFQVDHKRYDIIDSV